MTEFFTRSHWSAVDRLGGLIFIAVLIGIIVWQWVDQVDRRDPIQSRLLTEALNSPIFPGDNLVVRVTRDKVRDDCPVISVREITDEDGRKTVIPGDVWLGGPAGSDDVDIAYPIPDNTKPGSYVLRVTLTYVCRDVEPFIHRQEPTRFRVIARGSATD